jgi:hypothetical protein
MAVTVTDTRTIIDQADSTTGWTGAAATSTTVFAESNASVVQTLNIATEQIYFTDGTPRDVSNTLIYIWSNNFALQDVWDAAAPPHALHIGDGTDRISFKMAGANRLAFAHLEAGTGVGYDWECLVLDGSQASAMNTAGHAVARAGSFAGLNLSAITQFGSDFTTLSKGLGGGINVAVDIIRIGNNGLIITGGTTGDRGNFLEIVNLDKSTADQRAHGIIREYTTDLYGLQGPLTFGDGTGTGTSWFQDSNVVLVFENRNISNDKYYLAVTGNATGETHFILTGVTIATAGPFVTINFNGTNIDELSITGCSFRGLSNAVSFGNDADAANHVVTGNTFNGCGQINPGDVDFSNNIIQSSTASATGAVLLDADGSSNWSDLSFVSGGTGHAIYITATGTYTFSNFTYSGYGANDTTDAAVYNNSGGAVTINVSGGGSPTVRNGAGASTEIVAGSVTTLINIKDFDGNNEAGVAVYLEAADASGDLPFEQAINSITRSGTDATVTFAAAHGLETGEYLKLHGITDKEEDLSGAHQVTVTGPTTLTYQTTASGSTNYSGTITGTGATIYGTTDANGNISSTRAYSTDQPLTGYARKSDDGVTYFKAIDLDDTVNSVSGLTINRRLVEDGLVNP